MSRRSTGSGGRPSSTSSWPAAASPNRRAPPHPAARVRLGARGPGITSRAVAKLVWTGTAERWRSLCELVGPERILLGSDFPFAPEPVAQVSIDGLTAFDGFDERALRLIERGNALALWPRLRDVTIGRVV